MVDQLFESDVNKRRIEAIESCFATSGKTLNIPGRVLIGEGVLVKVCRKCPKYRQFYLFNDILLYGTILISKRLFNNQRIIPLHEISIKSIDDNEQYSNAWIIHTKSKSFIVYAANADEKSLWIGHINKCIRDLLRKSGKKPIEQHAALWVPDAEAQACMHCHKDFSLFVRRHHCRNCGIVVCATCSSKTYIVPNQGLAPVRVCESCYYVLKQKSIINKSKKTPVVNGMGIRDVPLMCASSEESVSQSDFSEDNLAEKAPAIFYKSFSNASLEDLTNNLPTLNGVLTATN